jgi:hypothetical protein
MPGSEDCRGDIFYSGRGTGLRINTKAIRITVIVTALLVVAAAAFLAGWNFSTKNNPVQVSSVNSTQTSPSNLSMTFFGFYKGFLYAYPNGEEVLTGGNVTIPFQFTPDQTDQIIKKINDIGFFKLPYDCQAPIVTTYPYQMFGPAKIAYIDITYNGQSNKVFWTDTTPPSNPRKGLTEFVNLIKGFIESSQEYKKLPPPPLMI